MGLRGWNCNQPISTYIFFEAPEISSTASLHLFMASECTNDVPTAIGPDRVELTGVSNSDSSTGSSGSEDWLQLYRTALASAPPGRPYAIYKVKNSFSLSLRMNSVKPPSNLRGGIVRPVFKEIIAGSSANFSLPATTITWAGF